MKIKLPDNQILEFPADATDQEIQDFLDDNINNKKSGGIGQTISDIGTGLKTGVASLPLGAQQLAADVTGATGGERAGAGIPSLAMGFLADPVGVLSDPELRQELLNTDVGQLRAAQASAAQRLAQQQAAAEQTSPVLATAANLAPQILQTGSLGAVSGGATFGALTPNIDQQNPQQALGGRAAQTAVGAAAGKVLDKTFQKVVQKAPVVAGKIADIASNVPNSIKLGIAKVAKINPTIAKDLADNNVASSMAVISDSPGVKILDRFLSRFPGSAGVLQDNATKSIGNIETRLAQLGADKALTIEQASNLIRKGAGNFSNKFSNVSERLFSRLDKYVPKTESTPINNTLQFIDDTLAATAGTPNLQAQITSGQGFGLLKKLAEDAKINNGAVPYSALRQYRTLFRQQMSNPMLLGSEDNALLQRAYGALSADMRETFAAKGSKALSAFDETNRFYAEGQDFIRNQLQPLIDTGKPDAVFEAALSGVKQGGARIRGILRSLNPGEREYIRGTVLDRMGKAAPGQQNALGTEFSPNTFLTNWNKISPEAKTALFGSNTMERKALDSLVRSVDAIKNVNRFSNPSGTAQMVNISGLMALSYYNPAAGVLAIPGAYAGGRLLTNQKFLRTLGNWSQKRITPTNVGNFIKSLENIAVKNPQVANDIAQVLARMSIVLGMQHKNKEQQ